MINRYIPYEYAVKAFDGIINKCQTVQEANALFKAKEAVTAQVCNLIDLQPVKHGEWEYYKNIGILDIYKCTVCKMPTEIAMDVVPSSVFCFCPRCGARMDGDSE